MNIFNNAVMVWAIIAGVLIVAELFTGTFFLLVIALGALAASILAILNFALAMQIFAAAAIMLLGILILRRKIYLSQKPNFLKQKQTNKNMGDISNLDQGQIVLIKSWQGRWAITQYRGAEWQVVLSSHVSSEPIPGNYVISHVDGIVLVVNPAT